MDFRNDHNPNDLNSNTAPYRSGDKAYGVSAHLLASDGIDILGDVAPSLSRKRSISMAQSKGYGRDSVRNFQKSKGKTND